MVSNPGPCRDQRLSTTDFSYCTETCYLQKLSDYSAAVGCNRKVDEENYKTIVGNLGDAKICILTWQRLKVGVDMRRIGTPLFPFMGNAAEAD